MAYDPNLLDALEEAPLVDWEGVVHRFTSARRQPDRENIGGARWNPVDVATIYTAMDIETLKAEFRYALESWVPPPDPSRFCFHRIQVTLAGLVDLTDASLLTEIGLDSATLSSSDFKACQQVGGAVDWLGFGGLIVPSARRGEGRNIVIFTAQQPADYRFEVLETLSAAF